MRKPRVSKLIPTGQIEHWVARQHVSTSDDWIRTRVRERAMIANGRIPEGMPFWTVKRIAQAEAYAIWCHTRNRELYAAVMSGKF